MAFNKVFVRPDNCPICHSPVKEIKKTAEESKSGKAFHGFFCQNKDCGNVVWSPKEKTNNASPASDKPQPNGMQIIGDELGAMNKKLDKIINHLDIGELPRKF